MSYNDQYYEKDGTDKNYSDESPDAIKADIARTRQDMGNKLNRIQNRLSPENLKVQAQDAVREFVNENTESLRNYLSEHSKEIGTGVAHAIKRNPIPAALVGLGLGWLLVESMGSNDSAQQNRPTYYRGNQRSEQDWQRYNSSGNYDAYGYEGTTPYTNQSASAGFGEQYRYNSPDVGAYSTQGSYGYQGQRNESNWRSEQQTDAQGKVSELAQQAGEKWHEATDKAHDYAEQARQQASQLGEQAQQYVGQAQQYVGQARQQAGQLGEQVQQQAAYVSEQAGVYAQRAGETVQRSLEENPLIFGGVALAIGAVVGLALPQTRRENEMMGQWRDEVIHSAQEVAQDALQRAEKVVEEVRPELEQTAQKVAADLKASGSQALTDLKESGRQALDNVKQTGQEAAAATKETLQKAENKAKVEAGKTAELTKDKANQLTS